MNQSTTTSIINEKPRLYFTKIIAAWFLGLIALSLAGFIGQYAQDHWNVSGNSRQLLQAIIMSGLVLPGIWFLWKGMDRQSTISIGLGDFKQSLMKFAFGAGLIAVPLTLTVLTTEIAGWGNVQLNINEGFYQTTLLGLLITFLFEALPEEMLFRGYIFSNLNVQYKKWVSAILAVGLFVLLPLFILPIQKWVLGMEGDLGGSSTVTLSYIITMFLFGSFTQYLRVLTGSVWTGIGFHLLFVYLNRLIGPNSNSFIQITDMTDQTPVQILFAGQLLLIFTLLLLYPKIAKKRIGWNDRNNN